MNITRSDKNYVVEIIEKSMCHLPGVKWVIGDHPVKGSRRMHNLAEYIFEVAYRRSGIILSKDRNGVAILCRSNATLNWWQELLLKIKFVTLCCGLGRVAEMKERDDYIRSQRPVNREFLYFWVFSVLPGARKFGAAASELKDEILRISDELNMPVYLETSLPQNKRVYERYGFTVYHEWNVKKRGFTLWFMKREPSNSLS